MPVASRAVPLRDIGATLPQVVAGSAVANPSLAFRHRAGGRTPGVARLNSAFSGVNREKRAMLHSDVAYYTTVEVWGR
jgi:hypothetical protein